MKARRSYQHHLVINEVILRPGSEWTQQASGWTFIYVASGAGYWLHQTTCHAVPSGAGVMLPGRMNGSFRASQVDGATFQFFSVNPERLTGLVTLSDQHFFQRAAQEDRFRFRMFLSGDLICDKFRSLRESVTANNNFPLRLKLLELFVESFGEEFGNLKPQTVEFTDARTRLMKILAQTVEADLLGMTVSRFASEMRCTTRHFSRTFHQVVGMSFRDKQAELRLLRARELLATTSSKVLEVALESGFESASLFNLLFKRSFGVTPGEWRKQIRNGEARSKRIKRFRFR